MTETTVTRETFGFSCQRCGHAWERVYEIRRCTDCEGDEILTCICEGKPALAPWSELETACPRCGGLRVKLVPQRGNVRLLG